MAKVVVLCFERVSAAGGGAVSHTYVSSSTLFPPSRFPLKSSEDDYRLGVSMYNGIYMKLA
jgi:hypothetical protein